MSQKCPLLRKVSICTCSLILFSMGLFAVGHGWEWTKKPHPPSLLKICYIYPKLMKLNIVML